MEDIYDTINRAFVGFTIFSEKNWSKTWLIFQFLNFIIGILCFIFTTGFVVANHNDLFLFIQGACIWATGIMMTVSLCICLLFRTNFQNFLEEMAFKDKMLEMPFIRHALITSSGKKMAELKTIVLESREKIQKYMRLLLKIYVSSSWGCATMYLCSPIYQMLVREDDSLRLLAFDMWFPWSLENFNVYIASFILHAYCGYLCCITYPGFQLMIILLVAQIIRQLKILTFILSNLNELMLEMAQGDSSVWQVYCSAVLKQCIEHYVKIKRSINKLNVICRPFYLALILDATLLVCMCSVKIAISNKSSLDTTKYYIHEFSFVVIVLMFCLIGQQVENECEQLEIAVTEKWYIFNSSHKRSVLIFNMAVSQKMPFYIFGTIPLSLSTFTWFIKTGMSFFTLVMSFFDEDN